MSNSISQSITLEELIQDFKKLAEVAWDCNCGRGWYDVEESSDELWRLICKYGFKEDGPENPTKYNLWNNYSAWISQQRNHVLRRNRVGC